MTKQQEHISGTEMENKKKIKKNNNNEQQMRQSEWTIT